jgi:hypothetical protein
MDIEMMEMLQKNRLEKIATMILATLCSQAEDGFDPAMSHSNQVNRAKYAIEQAKILISLLDRE